MRAALLLAALLSLGNALAQPADGVQVDEGRLPSGAVYRFERPAQWQRGPLLVYSSGYSASWARRAPAMATSAPCCWRKAMP